MSDDYQARLLIKMQMANMANSVSQKTVSFTDGYITAAYYMRAAISIDELLLLRSVLQQIDGGSDPVKVFVEFHRERMCEAPDCADLVP